MMESVGKGARLNGVLLGYMELWVGLYNWGWDVLVFGKIGTCSRVVLLG